MRGRPKTEYPAWRYGPDGQAKIFQNAEEVPEGWVDHPDKVGQSAGTGSTPDSADTEQLRADYERIVGKKPGKKKLDTLRKEIDQETQKRAAQFFHDHDTDQTEVEELLRQAGHDPSGMTLWDILDVAERELVDDD